MLKCLDIKTILEKKEIEKGLEQYLYIMEQFNHVNVAENIEFQKAYRKFYRLYRNYSDNFCKEYFTIMENLKYDKKSIRFDNILHSVSILKNRLEISYSSKMLHTLNPSYPIWDSIVTKKHFNIQNPPTNIEHRELCACNKYNIYVNQFYDYLKTDEAKAIIKYFDEKYPNNISDVKKIDFILWQDRIKKP